MALYIDLEKINENDLFVEYKFFTDDKNIGILKMRKSDGHVSEVQPTLNDDAGLIFNRAASALMRHWKENEYPEKTCWAS